MSDKLLQRSAKYTNNDEFLGKDILTLANKMSSSRSIMFSSNLDQFVVLTHPETPKLFTNYENAIGKYSSSYKKADRTFKIVKKISKFPDKPDNIYTLIIKYDDDKSYDILERKEYEKLTENYGYKYINNIDNFKEGDKVEKGTLLYKSTSFDDNMNYMYGRNFKVLYLINNATIEDAITVSEDVCEKMESIYVDQVEISLNLNDLLVNLYGKNGDYKVFPDIGEEIKNNLLAARRRIDYEYSLYDLQTDRLNKIDNTTDTLFYASGIVEDVEIYSNRSIEELEKYFYNSQIIKYIGIQTVYQKKIANALEKIINSGAKYSDNLSYLYRRLTDGMNENIQWSNETVFDNLLVKIKLSKKDYLHIGSKLTGRCGDKGVISKICKKEEMPYTEDGEYVDIIMNALGVVNRLNPTQLFEIELCFISNEIVKKMKKLSEKERPKLLFDFLLDVNEDFGNVMKAAYKECKDKNAFIDEVMEKGIPVYQPPFYGNVDLDKLAYLYKKYDIKAVKMFYKGKQMLGEFVVGERYMMKLKHTPKTKFSTRSSSYINNKNAPSKSLSYKKHNSLYPSTPIRLGRQFHFAEYKLCELLGNPKEISTNNSNNLIYVTMDNQQPSLRNKEGSTTIEKVMNLVE